MLCRCLWSATALARREQCKACAAQGARPSGSCSGGLDATRRWPRALTSHIVEEIVLNFPSTAMTEFFRIKTQEYLGYFCENNICIEPLDRLLYTILNYRATRISRLQAVFLRSVHKKNKHTGLPTRLRALSIAPTHGFLPKRSVPPACY